jgi:PAS domain S-box-containing protein
MNKNEVHYFLKGGGEMGKLIRAKNWSTTPIGDPENWPQSLRTLVSVMLDNPFGMYIAWGKEYTQIYNDGYRPILGSIKHPAALGNNSKETFAEAWHIIEPMFDGVMNGTPVGFPNFALPLNRNGYEEVCYFDFAYSPIRMENGEVGGVLVTVIETTNKNKAIDELKASERRFKTLADNIPNLAWMASADGWIYWYNKKWYDYTGATPNQMEGWGWQSVHDPNEVPRVMDKWGKSIATGEPFEMIFPLKGADGEFRQFLTRVLPIKNEEGKIIQWFGTNTDITIQKEAEEALTESKNQLRFAIDAANLATWEIDPVTRKFSGDERLKRWHGLETDTELSLDTVFELVIEKDRVALANAIDEAMKFSSGGRLDHRFSINNPHTKQVGIVRAKGKVIFNDKNQPEKFTGTLQIITGEEESKRKIEENERNLRLMILQAPVAIAIFRGEDYVTEIANTKALELWDRTENEVLDKPILEALPELAEQGIKQLLDDVRTTGIRFVADELPLQISRKGQIQTVYINFSYEPLYNTEGEINGIMAIGNDVTTQVVARKNVEESEKRYYNLIYSSPSAIGILYGEDLIITIANDPILHIWGKGREIIGKSYFDALPELAEQGYKEIFAEVYKTGIPFNSVETPVRIVQNGEETLKYYNFLLYAQWNIEGKVDGIGIIATEVTSQALLNNKLKESEQSVRAIVESAPFPIGVYTGSELRIEFANQTIMDVWGKGNDVIGKLYTEILPELQNQQIFQQVRGVLSTGIPFHAKNQRVDLLKNGALTPYYFNYSFTPLVDISGKTYGVMNTAADVTELHEAKQKVEESEKHFRNMVSQSPIPMTILRGKDYIIESANKVMIEDIWRKREDEVIGNSILDVFPELKNQKYPELLHEVFTSGKTHREKESVAFIEGNDGLKKFYFDFEYAALFNADNTISGIMITVTDVTDKVEARIKIEENQEKLNIVIEASELGTWEYDIKKEESFSSDRFLEIFGFSGEKYIPHNQIISRFHPDDLIVRKEAFKKAFEKGTLHYEARVILDDKSLRWVEIKGKVFYDINKAPARMIGTIRDISKERNFQQTLMEREEKFRLLADSMPQHIWTSDPEGTLNYFNQSVFDFSGMTQEEIDRDGWIQIVHPEDKEMNIEKWMESVATGKDFLIEHRFRKHDGEYRWQLSRAIPQRDQSGKIKMWVGTSTDIQDQKMFTNELEKKVSERTSQLKQSNIELEKMNKELQSFAYISSHDLQEPLRKIQTIASQINEKEFKNLSANGRDKFTRIQNAAMRMQNLIQDLLAYSRANSQEKKFERTDLATILDEVKDDLREEILQKQAIIELSNSVEINIIPFQFAQLMVNLVSNSLKFSDGKRSIRINIKCEIANGSQFNNDQLSKKLTYCNIIYTDNGIGFEQEYGERIFEVFQRLHKKEDYPGTGIGLAIVKKIVENHNGVITAKGELNKGATFSIYIPLKDAPIN